jgi:hypothetical protein
MVLGTIVGQDVMLGPVIPITQWSIEKWKAVEKHINDVVMTKGVEERLQQRYEC